MLIAGEASGDMLAAELVEALRPALLAAEVAYTSEMQPLGTGLEPRFFGAGGPRMREAGVEVVMEMIDHSVVGISEPLKHYLKFRRIFYQLRDLALEREPDAIICVDFSWFNSRFARAVRQHVRPRQDWFHDWQPRIIKYISPQVWASREGRAYELARDHDLLLSIFPFEKEWYARRVPGFAVEFIGHPLLDRFRKLQPGGVALDSSAPPLVLLLPGSRAAELRRHLPVMLEALQLIRKQPGELRAKIVLPSESLAEQAGTCGIPPGLEVQTGGLSEALAETAVAIASTGTVTMECAYFGVPTVALYTTSWASYQLAKRVVKVRWLSMPNLLANEEIYPEFIQGAATPENLSRAALTLLRDESRRVHVKARLAKVVASLGDPGANRRAAAAIVRLFQSRVEVEANGP